MVGYEWNEALDVCVREVDLDRSGRYETVSVENEMF